MFVVHETLGFVRRGKKDIDHLSHALHTHNITCAGTTKTGGGIVDGVW